MNYSKIILGQERTFLYVVSDAGVRSFLPLTTISRESIQKDKPFALTRIVAALAFLLTWFLK